MLFRTAAVVGFAIALAAAAGWSAPAHACTCLPADLATVYNQSDDVLRVRILSERSRALDTIYRARVRTAYKGCLRPGQKLQLVTPAQSSACGVDLEVGGEYLVTGHRRGAGRALDIALCGVNVPFSSLGPDEIAFLDTRFNCCGDDCACVNSELVQCFVDPCDVASCPEGICTSNYCGGCRAEFADEDGAAVCQPCTVDEDCPWFGQRCAEDGRCRRACAEDAECAAGEWCAPTDAGGSECRAYQRPGRSCGAYTTPGAAQRCAPGFSCEPSDPRLPDLGGRCRRSCVDSSDCPSQKYCAPSNARSVEGAAGELGICRRDGTCATAADCGLPGNHYPIPLCIGELTCENGTCGIDCGAPRPGF